MRNRGPRPGRDGNPLRRPVDRARARLAPATAAGGVLAAVTAAVVAVAAHRAGTDAARRTAAHRHQVTAITLPVPGAPLAGHVPVPARWSYPAGHPHTGHVRALATTAVGTRIPLWVDDSGDPAPPPPTPGRITGEAVDAALAALTVAALVGTCVQAAVRRHLDARAAAGWARDWERVEPHWSGRSRSA
ncbi:Rv1733c family protein [Streptantibioticus cattleyicolor]|uniref:Integral membrane protein n=1 Tax=Streptantibioticus cattleyicolor (strain ATCC 35852 / DSM 46488 / JCM 4925 / NBRC 14057 / NRRL 8057) TaxID=1003195 RepID=F8JMG0_STREN|nr:hypothetical protein [Streptantibioticus cattleyicolor]AEW99362.1 hypothetical protein SCATT_p11690 [Streptantibioticus cattleyicolor NRRL 8057 = DSM 46488]CCB71598.1 conserved exported protein of unknown function [Streptantibioticus cattleyicolor NRRL 8057 = DSM 46488]